MLKGKNNRSLNSESRISKDEIIFILLQGALFISTSFTLFPDSNSSLRRGGKSHAGSRSGRPAMGR
jgi:hypothetical protein